MLTTIPYPGESRTYRFDIDTKIINQMKMIEEWRGYMKAIAQLGRLTPEMRRENTLAEALASVRLEGASVDTRNARELIASDREPRTRAEREFVNYVRLIGELDCFHGAPGQPHEPIRESDVRQCHAGIVAGTLENPAHAGNYRTGPVIIARQRDDGTRETLHEPPDALLVPELMTAFVDWIALANSHRQAHRLPALITAALVHYECVRIHPFFDGNGRTARFLTTLVLLQHGYDFRDLFCITEYYDQSRDQYTSMLNSVDHPTPHHTIKPSKDPDAVPKIVTTEVYDASAWLRYFLGGLAKQMLHAEHRVTKALANK